MSEVTCLELSIILWIVHLACVLGAAQFAVPLRWRLSSRDQPAAPKGVLFGRANRALANTKSLKSEPMSPLPRSD